MSDRATDRLEYAHVKPLKNQGRARPPQLSSSPPPLAPLAAATREWSSFEGGGAGERGGFGGGAGGDAAAPGGGGGAGGGGGWISPHVICAFVAAPLAENWKAPFGFAFFSSSNVMAVGVATATDA